MTTVPVQAQVATIDLARAVLTDPAEAGPIDQVEEITIDPAAALVIWTARLRTGRVADNRANVSRVFKAAALIDPVAAEDSATAVIASVVAEDLEEEDLADLAEAAAAGSEAADEN
jgi:hypothetical protein